MTRYLSLPRRLWFRWCQFSHGAGSQGRPSRQAGGLSDSDLETLREDPETAPLEDFQKALLLFVLKVVRTPNEVQEGDVRALREMGWTDQDIFDAAYHAVSMIAGSTPFKAFVK